MKTQGNLLSTLSLEHRFEDYQPLTESQAAAKRTLLNLADRMISIKEQIFSTKEPFPYSFLQVLYGRPGVGKTHLLHAFMRHLCHADERFSRKIYYGIHEMMAVHSGNGSYLYAHTP